MRSNTTPYTQHSGAPGHYYLKLQAAAAALWAEGAGDEHVLCPRDGCAEAIQSFRDGSMTVMRCPHCGVIFRGNRDALLRML